MMRSGKHRDQMCSCCNKRRVRRKITHAIRLAEKRAWKKDA